MWKPIASIIVIIVTIVFSLTFVVPGYQRVKELRQNIATLDGVSGDIKTSKELEESTAILLEQIPQESDSRFSLLIPEEVDHLRFANMLKVMATNRGIALRDMKINRDQGALLSISGDKKDQGLLENIKNTFSLDSATRAGGAQATGPKLKNRSYSITQGNLFFTTTYQGFLTFLSDVEKSLILMNVTELSFAPHKEGSKKSAIPLYDYQMQVETYSIK